MAKSKGPSLYPPLVFNIFKPAKMSSYDVVRHFKKNLPQGYGKIGHFGTLDPFACGVLMVGIGGAARLNDYIHEYLPKTYLATGKLGIQTPTGDYESEIIQTDESDYLKSTIAHFSKDFIEEFLRSKFLGDYLQAPHQYSASKFMGRKLHEWAREGVEIKKEPVLRHVYSIEVVRYAFPYLSLRVSVSSGTYVRTLFAQMCEQLGTLGSLIALVREGVGKIQSSQSLKKSLWPKEKDPVFLNYGSRVDHILPFSRLILDEREVGLFKNGAFLKSLESRIIKGDLTSELLWIYDQSGKLLGLADGQAPGDIRPKINFSSLSQESPP